NRESLQCVFVLVDSRVPPQKADLEFCFWLGEHGIPFLLVFTKADKQSKHKTMQTIAAFKKELLVSFEEVPQQFITSSESQEGREDLLTFIDQINKDFIAPILDNI